MHLTGVWVVPLVAGGVGAAALSATAFLVRREVDRLQRSMRPLRVSDRHRPEGRRTGDR